MRQILFLSMAFLIAQATAISQNPTVVFSQNKCDYAKLGQLREGMKKVGAPILNDLVQKGQLLNWGILEHSWGDEWNYNNYYVAKDIPTFLEAFNTMVEEGQKVDSTFITDFWDACFEHKDAMYTETMGYNASGSGPLVKSMTMFNLPDGVTADAVKASLEEANKAIAKLGYPGNGYTFYMVSDDSVQTEKCLVEGSWLSQDIYDVIHDSDEWKEATSKDKEMWDKILAKRMYRRYHKQ